MMAFVEYVHRHANNNKMAGAISKSFMLAGRKGEMRFRWMKEIAALLFPCSPSASRIADGWNAKMSGGEGRVSCAADPKRQRNKPDSAFKIL